ncbi:TPA: hypothetical protein NPN70_001771 [Klebsiella quasipneumoniae subsp. similipneumoniae]|nr:hypothetical protein [Klebsiella quasipneumoniae subsp. quasipneumoniae]HCI6114399.1 hypothetical protein [Klebsiella quasipneumoniae subsp. similipneumoniae]
MNNTLSDSQLEAMIKSAVNSSGPLPPDEKFSQLVSALRELQERRKAAAKTITLPTPACTYADHSYPAYTKQQVLTMLESLGVTVVEEDV